MTAAPHDADTELWFVYDGQCLLCRMAAKALRMRTAVGSLRLLDARQDANHPLLREIRARGLDLDRGSVIRYGGNFYHGAETLTIMALLGSPQGWFNRMNAWLFRFRPVARLAYPALRAGRNALLRMRGVAPLRNLEDPPGPQEMIFRSVFGETWGSLPPVLRKHYEVRASSPDQVTVEGQLDVTRSALARCLSPLLRLSGALVPFSGTRIPVTVRFTSPLPSRAFHFDRIFHFPGRAPVLFRSRMEQLGGARMIELMRFGLGWKLRFFWDGTRIRLAHEGYAWRILGIMIPLPLALLIGRGEAWEEALSEDAFRMHMSITHPWFGRTYSYGGTFRLLEGHDASRNAS